MHISNFSLYFFTPQGNLWIKSLLVIFKTWALSLKIKHLFIPPSHSWFDWCFRILYYTCRRKNLSPPATITSGALRSIKKQQKNRNIGMKRRGWYNAAMLVLWFYHCNVSNQKGKSLFIHKISIIPKNQANIMHNHDIFVSSLINGYIWIDRPAN